jgi:hypothetical protein
LPFKWVNLWRYSVAEPLDVTTVDAPYFVGGTPAVENVHETGFEVGLYEL